MWDNWTDMGAIAHIIQKENIPENQKVKAFFNNRRWNIDHMHFPEFLAEHIHTINIGEDNLPDQPIWKPTHRGTFSTSSAWSALDKPKRSLIS